MSDNTWRPIDTAPKNGRHVLLLVEGLAIEGWWDDWWPRWSVVWLGTHGCGCCGGYPVEPKGWLPLPGAA